MPDPRRELHGRFQPNARFTHFGNALARLNVKGIRCHADTSIELASPITAFSGLNGTGKTTLLHLAAAAYKSSNHYTINSFLSRGPLDLHPFRDDASVHYTIEQSSGARGPLTLSYNAASSRWQGYSRRPVREVFFFGVGFFLPSNERRDFVFRNASALTVQNTADLDDLTREYCGRILSHGYDRISNVNVSHKNQTAVILSTKCSGVSYSEAHMGCGEGRIHTLVRALESCPPKSLILLEEPEISLHPVAEYELGKYLIDFAIRKGHQILLTTHSERLMRALPQNSMVHLCRTDRRLEVIPAIPSIEAESLMSGGYDPALVILVEDSVAKIVLTELLRRYDPFFLKSVRIAIGRFDKTGRGIEDSGKDAIRRAMKTLSEAGLKIAAVLDGDDAEDVNNSIYKLPGNEPPEAELVKNAAVQTMLSQRSGVPVAELQTRLAQLATCHEYFPHFARLSADEPDFVLRAAAETYANTIAFADVRSLIEFLKEDAAG